MSQAKKLAHLISAYGRNGDDMLVHMSRDEVRALHLMGGIAGDGMTINPDTGLPEAFNLSWLIPIAAIAAMALTGGAAAPALATEAAGATTAAGAGIGAAATDAALTTAATTTPAALAAAAPTATTIAGTTAAGTGAGIGAAANAASTLAAPATASVASAAPAAEAATTLGKMADFATNNPLLTIYGLNAAGNAFTPEVKQQDDSNSDPGMEFRPGEGRVPFETRGVRSFNPSQISPSGVEQNWISYGPSVPFSSDNSSQMDTRNFRRFAQGGFVQDPRHATRMNQITSQGIAQGPTQTAGTYGDMLAQMKAQYATPFMPSQDMQDGQFVSGNAGKAAMMGHLRNNRAPTMQNAGNAGSPPPAPPPHDPSWYIQGLPAINDPQMTRVAMPVAPQTAQMPQQNINDILRPPVQNYAMGGPVAPMGGGMPAMPAGAPPAGGIAQGVEVPPVAPAAPMGVPMDAPMPNAGTSGPDDQKLIQLAAAAMTGKIPNGEKILQMFVAKFGPGALKQLAEMINPQPSENVGRLMQGPGTGTSDSIPAVIDGHQPAALSTGEFVVPAKAVKNLGGGSTQAGANKLQSMVNTVSKAPGRGSPGVVDDPEVMSI